jgi:hypothetical protein
VHGRAPTNSVARAVTHLNTRTPHSIADGAADGDTFSQPDLTGDTVIDADGRPDSDARADGHGLERNSSAG